MDYHKGTFTSGPHTGETAIQVVRDGQEVDLFLEDGTALNLDGMAYSFDFTETFIQAPSWAATLNA